MDLKRDRPTTQSVNPIAVELARPETLSDSERQLRLLDVLKSQLSNNLMDLTEVISPLVKLVATNNASVKVFHSFGNFSTDIISVLRL